MTRKQRMIVASLRDQMLDVTLGTITAAEWHKRVRAAIALGCDVPNEWIA